MALYARLILAGLSAAIATPVFGQHACGTHANVVDKLGRNYQEAIVGQGVAHSGKLIEVFSTADGSTWTIVVTNPQGISCLVAAGEGWRQIKPEPGDES